MSTPAKGAEAADAAGSRRKRRRRGGIGADVARAVRDAPEAGPLVVVRRKVVQHLADELDEAMAAGNVLLVVKLNAQLELAIGRAGLDSAGSGEVIPDGDSSGGVSLDEELAALAAGEPTLGDASQV
ncbi:hypothetical protein [uncultured Friedmanniella sp.]|uniref:hypothetical protein n=1 Tax=uncultured Friedmanniella sp. TaxID=335381 RepID=UPI0035CB0366